MKGLGRALFVAILLLIAGVLNVIYGIAAVGNAHFFANTTYMDRKPLKFKASDTFKFEYVVAIYPEVKPADFLARRAEFWTARFLAKNP